MPVHDTPTGDPLAADLILKKGEGHEVEEVALRRL
jgi:hypothetical protein